MVDIVYNNGWKSGEFNLLLVDISSDHDGKRMIAALAVLGFGVAVVYDAEKNNE